MQSARRWWRTVVAAAEVDQERVMSRVVAARVATMVLERQCASGRPRREALLQLRQGSEPSSEPTEEPQDLSKQLFVDSSHFVVS